MTSVAVVFVVGADDLHAHKQRQRLKYCTTTPTTHIFSRNLLLLKVNTADGVRDFSLLFLLFLLRCVACGLVSIRWHSFFLLLWCCSLIYAAAAASSSSSQSHISIEWILRVRMRTHYHHVFYVVIFTFLYIFIHYCMLHIPTFLFLLHLCIWMCIVVCHRARARVQ